MDPIRILVDSFADADLLNAQMSNGREIMSRLDPNRFHLTTFVMGEPDARLVQRPNTRLIKLGQRGQTFRILQEFLTGTHDIVFYVKPSPAARMYLAGRKRWPDNRVVVGNVESQSDLRNEPTIKVGQVRLWERTVLRSDFLSANSACVQASLQREYGLKSEVVPTGVDTTFFRPDENKSSSPRVRVLFAGALRPFKGPQLLLHAAAKFRACDFVIAGDGVMAAELKDQARKESLDNVQFLGSLQAEALREQYQQSDIFLFPSRWEGSPKVIAEAAACGLPVIARSDYRPETVVDEITGYLGGSDDELLDRLSTLIADRDLQRKLGRAGREHILQFDWEIITRRWAEIFERLAGPGGGRKFA